LGQAARGLRAKPGSCRRGQRHERRGGSTGVHPSHGHLRRRILPSERTRTDGTAKNPSPSRHHRQRARGVSAQIGRRRPHRRGGPSARGRYAWALTNRPDGHGLRLPSGPLRRPARRSRARRRSGRWWHRPGAGLSAWNLRSGSAPVSRAATQWDAGHAMVTRSADSERAEFRRVRVSLGPAQSHTGSHHVRARGNRIGCGLVRW
jgi:hypothetical protein